MIKNELQIFLITYNRKKKLQFTIDEILNSPIGSCDITILDNASTDGTSELLDEYAKKHKNITHIRHNVNIGGNANICRAFEMAASCGKEYAWVLCDDDRYDFSNWSAVEKAIKQKTDLICVADYVYPDNASKSNPAYQIFQMTFVPATIFKTSLITNNVVMNMYDAIYTMFQQTCLTASVINNGGTVIVLDKPIVFNGLHFQEHIDKEDVSYVRGATKNDDILSRRQATVWILGFCNIISLFKDAALQQKCVEVAVPYKDIYGSWDNFYRCMYRSYIETGKLHYFYEIYKCLPAAKKHEIMKLYKRDIGYALNQDGFAFSKRCHHKPYHFSFKRLLKKMFSIDVSPDWNYRILRLCGFEIKLFRKK